MEKQSVSKYLIKLALSTILIAWLLASDSVVLDDKYSTNIPTAYAATASYDFSICGGSCNSSSEWWASGDDVDVFPFAGATANRNAHTQMSNSDYSAISASDDSRFTSINPGSGDEIFLWMEMPITEPEDEIYQLDFTFEGYASSTTTFTIWVKTADGNYQDNSSWTQVASQSITANTDTTITGSLTSNILDYIDDNGIVVWGVYEAAAAITMSVDYVKMDVLYIPVEQTGFRFRSDDGDESNATWIAAQNTNITREGGINTRLRIQLNDGDSGNPDSNQYQLEYKKSDEETYRKVNIPEEGSISYGTEGNIGQGTTFISVPYPTEISEGDLLVLAIANKHPPSIPSTPDGWTALENHQASGGAGSSGADSGNVTATIFVREATGFESGNVSVSISSGNSSIGRISRYSGVSGKIWDLAATSGSDDSAGTSWSVTGASNPGITSGDMIIVASAINTDARSYSAQSISATGATFSNHTERYESGTTQGNDSELVLSDHTVTGGTATTAPDFTMTANGSTTSNPAGASVILRARLVDAPIILSSSSHISSSGENTSARLDPPSGRTTGDFRTGRIQDDENPADEIDLDDGEYTEIEWNLQATDNTTIGDIYQFRITTGGAPLTYVVTPQWTIGESTIISVTVDDGSISYGTLNFNTSNTTLPEDENDTQTVTNIGNTSVDLNIKGQNTGCPWTLSSTNGNDQYIHEFSSNSGSLWSPLTTSYQTLSTNLAAESSIDFDLKITTPTTSSCSNQQSVDVTIQAVEN